MITLEVILPYPAPCLNPNSTVGWRKKYKAKKQAKETAYVTTLAALDGGAFNANGGRVNVDLTFHPPDHRDRDEDNALGSMKSALDGIAQGLRVDDKRFHLSHRFGPVTAGGCVVVTVTA